MIIHPNYSPSHFYWNSKITVEYLKIYQFFIKEYVKNLLPHPFATNCFDYSINQRNNVRPKSQSDCKLQQMERIERNKCRQNYYWEQKELKSWKKEYLNTGLYYNMIILENKTNNCSIKPNNNLLNEICKIDCKSIDYITEYDIIETKDLYYIRIITDKYYAFHLNSNYKPKMNFFGYFSGIGSLMSMWFGFCSLDFVKLLEKLLNRISFCLLRFLFWQKYKIRSFIHYFKNISFLFISNNFSIFNELQTDYHFQ